MASKHEDLVQRVYDVFNRGAVDELESIFTKDFIEHQDLGLPANGVAAVKEWLTTWRKAFPDARFEVLGMISDGDNLCVRMRATGTQLGEFMGLPASGRSFDCEGYDWVHVNSKGMVAEHWGAFEDLKMLTQLGALPGPGPTIDLTEGQRARH
jgi:C-1 hydroxylase